MKTDRENSGMPFYKRKLPYLWFCLALLVVVVGIQVYKSYHRSLPLSYHAKQVFKAIDNEDSRTLLQYSLEPERSKAGLNSKNLKALLKWSKTLWSSYPGRDGEMVIEGEDGSASIISCYRERTGGPGVRPPSLGFALHKSEDGPVLSVTSALIDAALYAKYAPHDAEVNAVEKKWISLSVGLRQETPILKSMGLKGVVETDNELTFHSFESLQKMADSVVRRLRREREAGTADGS